MNTQRSIKQKGGKKYTGKKKGLWPLERVTLKLAGSLPAFPRPPHGPHQGADLTVTQIVPGGNLTLTSGLSSGGISSGALGTLGSFGFALADLNQVSTWSAAFDQYRIEKVIVKITSRNNMLSKASVASPNQAVPRLYVVVDRDDASAPSALTDLYQYGNCQGMSPDSDYMLELEPSITRAIYAGGAFSGYEVTSERPWIDLSNTGVEHYGVKFGTEILQVSSTDTWQWTIMCQYVVSFRAAR